MCYKHLLSFANDSGARQPLLTIMSLKCSLPCITQTLDFLAAFLVCMSVANEVILSEKESPERLLSSKANLLPSLIQISEIAVSEITLWSLSLTACCRKILMKVVKQSRTYGHSPRLIW